VEDNRLLVLEAAHEGRHHGIEGVGGDVACTLNVAADVVCKAG
jgi:hypothetical protein